MCLPLPFDPLFLPSMYSSFSFIRGKPQNIRNRNLKRELMVSYGIKSTYSRPIYFGERFVTTRENLWTPNPTHTRTPLHRPPYTCVHKGLGTQDFKAYKKKLHLFTVLKYLYSITSKKKKRHRKFHTMSTFYEVSSLSSLEPRKYRLWFIIHFETKGGTWRCVGW